MIDRRGLVAGGIGASLLSLLPGADAQRRRVPFIPLKRIRHDVRTPQGQAMLAVYADGVAKMKALSAQPGGSQQPRSWNFQWYTHATPSGKAAALQQVFPGGSGNFYAIANAMWQTCQAHMPGDPEDNFLFWHRLYVLYFERMIAAVTGKRGFTLPYWDYTAPGNAAIPAQFRSPSDPVFGVLYRANRNSGVNAGQPIDQGAPGALNLDALKQLQYGSFNSTLDFGLHGNVHVRVGNGTNMGSVAMAANDPVFWLHHCNIDRIWYAWGQPATGRSNPTTMSQTFTFARADGTAATPALSSVAKNATLTYAYDKLPPVPKSLFSLVNASSARRTLLSSAPRGVAAAAGGRIELTGRPQVVPLQPTADAENVRSMRELAARPQRLELVLSGVSAASPPEILFGVYLDLPPGTPAERAEDHRIAVINFFGAVPMPGMEGMAHGPGGHGKTYVFDLTEVAQRLRARGRLQATSTITVLPFGTPTAGSAPGFDSVTVQGR